THIKLTFSGLWVFCKEIMMFIIKTKIKRVLRFRRKLTNAARVSHQMFFFITKSTSGYLFVFLSKTANFEFFTNFIFTIVTFTLGRMTTTLPESQKFRFISLFI